jgi:NAD(P)H-hydrate epimerase
VIPTVSVEQMREVDRLMIEELHIELLQMMENAGRALAEQARRLVGGDVYGAQVVVLAGRGGNGGGGLTAGRRLAIWGADVSVILGAARHEFQGVRCTAQHPRRHGRSRAGRRACRGVIAALHSADVVLDALIGLQPARRTARADRLTGPCRERLRQTPCWRGIYRRA